MYVTPNFKTKKALKEAVAKYNMYQAYLKNPLSVEGVNYGLLYGDFVARPVEVFSPGPFPCNRNGRETVEGPHYPKPHTWYASVMVENGIVVKVK